MFVQPFKSPNEIGEHPPIGIDKPIELVPVRRRVNASAAAVLDPIDKFLERHFVPELQSLSALVERDNAVPGVANKPEFEVSLELLAPDLPPALFRKQQIQRSQNPVLSSAVARPIRLHLVLDLPQIKMRLPCFAENGSDTGRTSLWHLNEDAFVFVRDHNPIAR